MTALQKLLPALLVSACLAAGVAAVAGGDAAKPTEGKVTRRAFRFQVHAEKLPAYKEWHRKVYPELLRDMTAAGIRNYSLFLDAEGNVFGYLESADWAKADAAMGASEANQRWQEVMKEYIIQPADPKAGAATALEEAFHLP
jgi:L-rhamnose mutarotase